MTKKEIKVEEIRVESGELSYDTKTLITIMCLLTVYPIGLVLMLVWMKWNKWVKFLVAFPVLFMLLIPICILLVLMIVVIKAVMEPGKTIETYEVIRDEIKKEIMISPTEVSTTKMVISPTIRVIK